MACEGRWAVERLCGGGDSSRLHGQAFVRQAFVRQELGSGGGVGTFDEEANDEGQEA